MDLSRPNRAVTVRQTVSGGGEVVITDMAALIERNLEAYRQAAHGAFSVTTERALRSDSAVFTEWCSSRALLALPAEPSTVATFIDDQALTKKPATIRRYVSSISHLHRAADVPNPCERSEVKLVLKRMGKTLGSAQRQAEGLTRRLVDKMMHSSGDTLRDLRNRVVLAVGYDTLARRSELVALRVEDLRHGTARDGTINICGSKTDQMSAGSIRYLAPDTMRLVTEWIGKAGIEDGFLLRAVLKGGRVGGALVPMEVTRVYKEMATAAGLPIETVAAISAHSTRVGASQDMAASDRIELPAIMQAGGWKSPEMVARYTARQHARRSGSAKLAELQNRTS
ncbi:tyrosine-type recombinase/integrase (plasmid) [Lichenicola cladoniae]|uniref:Tyrosine-type recombinase/integrase n=1 Tax=Lichenicola cladoniae TaxID=1484109 RepID=A0A6M8HXA4_9PROT|nr:tyrosine-type recombinase/integrase [Lichenicola cladoniae]NPD69741.1 tyrosine-type recombinase/integrase [Acetobacteraceae bacterium]QKE92970.1 tyrosine-type recombinase/integrase [Lichenicola cladoniae]